MTRARVVLVEEETVVPRGTRRITWRIREGGRWVECSTYPDATVAHEAPPAGTVWRRLVTVSLDPTAELERREERPGVHRAQGPLEALRGAPPRPFRGSARFRIGPAGALERVPRRR